MAEERLAEAVRKYPVLYDKWDKYFKDKNKKLLAWENKIPFLSGSLNISLTHILRTFFACSCFRLRILRFSSKYPKASKSSSSFIFHLSLLSICGSFEANLNLLALSMNGLLHILLHFLLHARKFQLRMLTSLASALTSQV